jgi:hypothetical protein
MHTFLDAAFCALQLKRRKTASLCCRPGSISIDSRHTFSRPCLAAVSFHSSISACQRWRTLGFGTCRACDRAPTPTNDRKHQLQVVAPATASAAQSFQAQLSIRASGRAQLACFGCADGRAPPLCTPQTSIAPQEGCPNLRSSAPTPPSAAVRCYPSLTGAAHPQQPSRR